ncbi:glutamate receptor ionotropic, delta-2-like [Eriocheir sinensis]|uniref:glutamate receptor ionotropic, delta-2-like n=1 Tax=Eriocheir sinensis TaxID=95602 RepID=UPI0021CA3F1A|nr:glutamate receptor ionotropic, delta-2-like [Eriocheir sinensis]
MLLWTEAEFALGPFTITPQRETVSDFAVPLVSENKAIFMQRPRQETDVAGFLKPFKAEVNCATILFVRAEGKIFGHLVGKVNSHALLWVLKALTQEMIYIYHSPPPPLPKGSNWLPRHNASRVLAATWLLASLVFMSSYGGILTAMLTVPRVTIPIDSLEDLVAQDDLPWRLEAGSMATQYLKVVLRRGGSSVTVSTAGCSEIPLYINPTEVFH